MTFATAARVLRYWMLERRIDVPKRCPSDPLTCGNVPLHRAPFGRLARGQAFIQQRSIRLYLRHKAFLSSASQQIGNDQYSEHLCEIHDLPSCSIKLNLPGQVSDTPSHIQGLNGREARPPHDLPIASVILPSFLKTLSYLRMSN